MFKNLEAEQARKGKTDADMAEILGIARETYNRKKKNCNFDFLEIKTLCNYFGLSFDYLFATKVTD